MHTMKDALRAFILESLYLLLIALSTHDCNGLDTGAKIYLDVAMCAN